MVQRAPDAQGDPPDRDEEAGTGDPPDAVVEPTVAAGAEQPTAQPDGDQTEPPENLGRSSVRGFAWTTLAWGINRLAILGMTLVLARILVPEDFGVVTAGLTVITILDAALDLGVGAAVVYDQEKGISRRVRAAMSLSLVISALVMVAGFLASGLLAELFSVPAYSDLFALLFLYPFFRGAGQVGDAVLKRDLLFRRRTAVDVTRAVVRIAVSVPLALNGAGAWSLAIGILASEAAAMLLLWAMVPIRPLLRPSGADLRSLVQFGGQVTGIRVLGSLQSNIDYLVVGSFLGAAALGYYGIAYRLPELAILNVLWIFTTVAFPMYARAYSRGMGALRSAMLRATRLVTLYGFAVGTTLAVVAPEAIPVLFSEQWQPAVVPMVLIVLGVCFACVGWASGDVFPALGRPGLLLKIDIPGTILITAGFLYASRWGLVGVAAVHLVYNVLYAIVRIVIAGVITETPGRTLLRTLAPGLLVGVAIAAVCLPLRTVLPTGELGTLVLLVLAALAATGVVTLLTARSAVTEVIGIARSR